MAELLGQIIDESRSLAVELSPPVLFDLGLGAGLRWLAGSMERRHGLEVLVDADPQAEPLPEDIRLLLFHAARELLTNVHKHAGVRQARVRLERADHLVRLIVEDQGRGLDPQALLGPNGRFAQARGANSGLGLFSLRERLELLGGRLEVRGAPGRGTRVTLEVPVGPPEPSAPGSGADASR